MRVGLVLSLLALAYSHKVMLSGCCAAATLFAPSSIFCRVSSSLAYAQAVSMIGAIGVVKLSMASYRIFYGLSSGGPLVRGCLGATLPASTGFAAAGSLLGSAP